MPTIVYHNALIQTWRAELPGLYAQIDASNALILQESNILTPLASQLSHLQSQISSIRSRINDIEWRDAQYHLYYDYHYPNYSYYPYCP